MDLAVISFPKVTNSQLFIFTCPRSCGQGEWHSKKHGKKQRRTWKKLHIGVCEDGWILASKITDSDEQDPTIVPNLLTECDQKTETFVGDGIYDQAEVYEAVMAYLPDAIIIVQGKMRLSQGIGHPVNRRGAATLSAFIPRVASSGKEQLVITNNLMLRMSSLDTNKSWGAGFTPNEKTRRKEKLRLDARYSTGCLR